MIEKLIYIILCHLIGDYVLQSDYIAANKGKDWYILFVHSALYCLPFIIVFGLDSRLIWVFIIHIVADATKARWNAINIVQDQMVHYLVAASLYLI